MLALETTAKAWVYNQQVLVFHAPPLHSILAWQHTQAAPLYSCDLPACHAKQDGPSQPLFHPCSIHPSCCRPLLQQLTLPSPPRLFADLQRLPADPHLGPCVHHHPHGSLRPVYADPLHQTGELGPHKRGHTVSRSLERKRRKLKHVLQLRSLVRRFSTGSGVRGCPCSFDAASLTADCRLPHPFADYLRDAPHRRAAEPGAQRCK